MVQRPRGTRDFTPGVMNRRLAFEKLLETKALSHGFKRVQTPIFETLDLFTAKSGPGVLSSNCMHSKINQTGHLLYAPS